MSHSRSAQFYYEIEETLYAHLEEDGYDVPMDAIKGALKDLFDSVAIHAWSRPDVYRVAWEEGWPISQGTADELLSNVEGKADAEFSITWLTFEIAVQEFFENFDWGKLKREEQESYTGHFLIERHYQPGADQPLETSLHLKSVSLAAALDAASESTEISGVPVSLYSIPKDKEPSLDEEWLEIYAHKLWEFDAEEE
ncbi:MAG: hypothetical protein HN736_09330 [Anaerolineae bacterium]|jgi:hypothetical protein|nr:hypothetical protein [Anaerolineae bacterium]MBT4458664.1 hypothetical protein [Anaerolineae bacterium]MBT6321515.1 hypothetical protein [Anaerolineae bacterium]MBT7774899.1 hypothetical protein [Anaerolineae bacterium]